MCKFLVTNFVLLAIAARAFSYDFEDNYFNQILASDLAETRDSLDYWSSVAHPRARRDEEAVGNSDKCRRRRSQECCNTEFMENLYNQDRDNRRECYKETYGKDKDTERPPPDPFKCDKVNKHRKDMTCFMKCVAQKRNLVDDDGNLLQEQFEDFVKSNFKEDWLSSSLDDIATKCLTQASGSASKQKTDTDSCNPAAIKGFHCLHREIQMKCPENLIKDTKSCARLRERIRKHQELPPTQQDIESE